MKDLLDYDWETADWRMSDLKVSARLRCSLASAWQGRRIFSGQWPQATAEAISQGWLPPDHSGLVNFTSPEHKVA